MSSQQQAREFNVSAVLGMFWNTPAGVGLTASELVGMTGLTRATILSICDELREQGWVTEDRAPSAIPGRGRQARRFTFNQRRYLIAAADVGFHSVTSAISDLKGTILGQAQVSLVDHQWQADRTQHLLDTFEQALREANVEHNEIEMGCIGVAAPVTYEGEPYPGQPFWELMRIDQERLRSFAPRWRIIIENDANLAALAEQEVRVGKLRSPMVTLLAGERLGAGVIVNGELLKGFHGGAGEMGTSSISRRPKVALVLWEALAASSTRLSVRTTTLSFARSPTKISSTWHLRTFLMRQILATSSPETSSRRSATILHWPFLQPRTSSTRVSSLSPEELPHRLHRYSPASKPNSPNSPHFHPPSRRRLLAATSCCWVQFTTQFGRYGLRH